MLVTFYLMQKNPQTWFMRKPVSNTALNGTLVRKQPNDPFRCFVWLVEYFSL